MSANPSLTIEFLDAAHGGEAARLIMEAFGQSADDARDVVARLLARNRTRDAAAALAAVTDGKLVGLVNCRKPEGDNPNGTFAICNLAVDRESRGSGIGHRLLQAAEDFIAGEWLKGKFGFAVLRDSTKRAYPSSHFYEDAGYVPYEDPQNLPECGDPALIKPLNEGAFDSCEP